MINILRFREYCLELMATVNRLADDKIQHCVLAVKEEHMVKKLRDKNGVCLCVNYPDAEGEGVQDNYVDKQPAFFFICEKVNAGNESDEQEFSHYARLQKVMLLLEDAIRLADENCAPVKPQDNYKIEWEYQIFGGFNGLSLGVIFKDYDRTMD